MVEQNSASAVFMFRLLDSFPSLNIFQCSNCSQSLSNQMDNMMPPVAEQFFAQTVCSSGLLEEMSSMTRRVWMVMVMSLAAMLTTLLVDVVVFVG